VCPVAAGLRNTRPAQRLDTPRLVERSQGQPHHERRPPSLAWKHTNVLQHIAGHLRERLDRPDREELHGSIDDYRRGLVPLVVPLTLLRHYVRTFDLAYLADHVYLDPHPKELMLLNHV
jgi:uncharacterized protein YbgA (DUF1722 family)